MISSVVVHSPTTARPFLKWAGGKSQLLSQYDRFFPEKFNAYYEPFLGSGAVFFHLRSQGRLRQAYLSDSNEDLINCYLCMRDHLPELLKFLERHQKLHSRAHYYRTRSRAFTHPVERAARLLYLNKTCYNGLYRLNSSGAFNVPIGQYRKPQIANEGLLTFASNMLQGTTLRTESFEGVLRRAQAGDFVYFDPPYQPLSATSRFTAYTGEEFTDEDQRHLRDVFATLARRGVHTLLSNSDSALVRKLYSDFHISTVRARRSINTNPAKRGTIPELVITNYHSPSTAS